MSKTLKDIVKSNDDLYQIKVEKPDKHNRSTWKFEITDPSWTYGEFDFHRLQTVHLRRDNGFFIAFRLYMDDKIVYFVDTQKAMFRSTVRKFVNSQAEYSIHTNDFSKTKNEPSFRITSNEMKANHINNFLDLCYEYREYSAIGTGYTRDIRNLLVLDIDVDCTKQENIDEINSLLLKFAGYNSLPDFYIFNHNSKHIQLQWLIQDLQYKEISKEVVDSIITELNTDKNKNKEVSYRGTDFAKITKNGIDYRRFTLAMCDIVKKRKFGDKNYTFWKAKNPMTAMEGLYDLELKIPYYFDGEIRYLDQDTIREIFSTRTARQEYFEEAPDITDIYKRLSELMDPLVKKVTEKKVMKINDAEDVYEKKTETKKEKKDKEVINLGASRNTFVLKCTQITTWETAKSYGFRQPEHIKNMSQENYCLFRQEVYKEVKRKFEIEDNKYNGIWPDTTNKSTYTTDEFKKTFDKSFSWSVQNFKSISFSDYDRIRSLASRHYKKDLKLMTVDKIRQSKSLSRNELLKEVNKSLTKQGIKTITIGSLKRYITISNNLSEDEREDLYNEKKPELGNRFISSNS